MSADSAIWVRAWVKHGKVDGKPDDANDRHRRAGEQYGNGATAIFGKGSAGHGSYSLVAVHERRGRFKLRQYGRTARWSRLSINTKKSMRHYF
ncbi:MAG: hypothetical protein WDN04_17525 [Rhodospirillales bacterium]